MLKYQTRAPYKGKRIFRVSNIVNTTIDHADKKKKNKINFPLPSDFDPAAYLALNPDVKANGIDPAKHWMEYGGGENRQYKYPAPSSEPTLLSKKVADSGYVPKIDLSPVPSLASTIEQPAMLGMGGTVSPPSNPTENKSNSVIETIKAAASSVTPEKIEKGRQILESGKGLITAAQKSFQKGATDPSRLPKTKALKEAEQIVMLPKEERQPTETVPFDKKYIFIIGGVLAVIVIIAFIAKR